MYSCLAGFVEQVESLEEAIAREVEEETGVKVSTRTPIHLTPTSILALAYSLLTKACRRP
jgi:8-oxo-dGTP pyrophosphatase MutT (NUDIX family)